MAWPSSGYTLGDTAAEADEARATWAAVAHAVSEFEPVRMVVDPSAAQVARDWLGSEIELFEAPLDDGFDFTRDLFEDWLADEVSKLVGVANIAVAARLFYELVIAGGERFTWPPTWLSSRKRRRSILGR
jgi:hypothetical protein